MVKSHSGMNSIELRLAVESDLLQINDIFNYYVGTSTCVWTTQLCTEEERKEWFASHDDSTPIIVAEHDGRIIGWGALSPFETACTFYKTVENSVYVHHEFQRRGIGIRILNELIRLGREAGIISIIAAISSDQHASIALHKASGFREVGQLSKVGYKFNSYRDLLYMQLHLTKL